MWTTTRSWRGTQALLRGSPQGATGHLQADLREPELILDRAAEVLDFERVATSQTLRTREQVARFFSGWTWSRRAWSRSTSGGPIRTTRPRPTRSLHTEQWGASDAIEL
jgi:S-adenosyl methyltransferase